MRKLLLLFVLTAIVSSAFSQNTFFTSLGENKTFQTNGKREIIPQKYHGYTVNTASLKNFLWSLPSEQQMVNSRNEAPVMEIPMPNGTVSRFRVWESSIMEPGLAAKFPDMKTFNGQGIDDPYATIRFDYNPYTGFHAQILSSQTGRIDIDPFAKGDVNNYISYNVKDYSRDVQFICGVVETEIKKSNSQNLAPNAACLGGTLRTYRLALACTGEYAVAVCSPNAPTVGQTAAAMLTSMNRVNGVYEKEVSLRMILVANNNNLIYLNGATDPYTNNSGGAMLGENQSNVDAIIGSANYDIGHVFSTGGGGIASLNSPCNASSKARGVTGQGNPVGDPFDIDYVAHEMGHQWGGNHSMAGCGSSPNSTKYEPGSGTTIQAYAGICSNENIQPNSDPHFHAISFDEISNYINGGGNCGVNTPTGNTLPVINPLPNNGLSIPAGTPFILSGSATDANGDALTYCWEQWDFSGTATWNAGATAPAGNTVPLFKSRLPKTTGERMFPDIAVILAGYPATPPSAMNGLKGETLSPVARTMKFKLTVRDNRAGGGGVVSSGTDGCQTSGIYQINVAASAPFVVTAPNTTGISWNSGSSQTITWDVAATNAAPISCANVSIELSTDGGLTFPVTIAASTANDGTEIITVPNNPTTQARIRVKAVGNIFFDINNANFTIVAANPDFDFATPAPATVVCGGPTSAVINLATTQTLGYSVPINLSATAGVPPGTAVNFSVNPVNPGSSVNVTLTNTNTLAAGNYDITIQGVSGVITKTRVIRFTVQPGAGPTVSSNPASQTICASTNVTFNAAATGALSQQWQVSTDGGNTWNNVAGQTGTAYTITGVTAALNNNRYRCVFTGQCNTSNSTAAVLTVQTAPAITSQPVSASICVDGAANFTVAASGTNLTYQWQRSTDGGSTWTNLSSNTPSIGVFNVPVSSNNTLYRCIVSGACTPSVISNVATLNVTSPAVFNTQPADAVFCGSGNAVFTVAATGTGVTYQWQLSTDGGTTYNNITGATTATLNVNATSTSFNNYRYRAVVNTTGGVCSAVNSNAARLSINPLPVVVLSVAPYTKLFPGLKTTVTATVTPAGGSYVWKRNGVTLPTVANTIVADVDSLGDYRLTVTGAGGCVGESNVLSLLDSATNKIFFYPNPNQGRFQVRYNNPQNANTQNTIRIFDSKGNKVYESKYIVTRAYHQMWIDLRAGGRGIYFVELSDAGGKRIAVGRVFVN